MNKEEKFCKDDEFVQKLGQLYLSYLKKKENSCFELNQDNYQRFLSVGGYFAMMAEKLGGEIEEMELIPKEEDGIINAVFDVFDISQDEIEVFSHAVSNADVFSIEPLTNDKIRIGIVVNKVYNKI